MGKKKLQGVDRNTKWSIQVNVRLREGVWLMYIKNDCYSYIYKVTVQRQRNKQILKVESAKHTVIEIFYR